MVNTPVSAGRSPRFAALRYPNFAILWGALIVSTAGGQMQQVAKSWLVLQQTDRPLALVALGLCYTVPTLVLSATVTGLVADRFDRIALLKVMQAWGTVQPLLLAFLLATGHLSIWLLFADTIATAALNAFNAPAQQALLPALVPPLALLSATALQSAVWTSAQLLGPALGGAILAASGAAWVFALNGLSTLAVLAALARLRGVSGTPLATPGPAPTAASGLRHAWADPALRGLLLLVSGLAALTGGYQLLLPLFARDIWEGGARAYGLLLAAPGVGAVLVTTVLAAWGTPRHPARVCAIGALVLCGALIGFANAPSLLLGLTLLVVVGAAGAVCGTIVVTLLQLLTPDHLRGRIMAVRYSVSAGMSYAGGLLAGGAVSLIGPVVVITGGALAFVVCLTLLHRPLRAAECQTPGISYP
jgi:MFS family permease